MNVYSDEGESMIETSKWLDGMMGLVVGDALGVPVEFMTREEIKNCSEGPVTGMRGHGTFDMPAGTWSDDSSMALATLDALNIDDDINLNAIMTRFIYWQDGGDYTPFRETFDEGNTCRAAIEAFKKDNDPKTCGVTGDYANGNGALMRILPICIYVSEKVMNGEMSDEQAVAHVHEVAALTHNHLRSCMCCGVYYFLTKEILKSNEGAEKEPIIDVLQRGMDEANAFYGKDSANAKEMSRLLRIWNLSELRDIPEHQIKSTGYVIDTIEAALWCLTTTDSYKDAVLKAVNLGDDTDTVGSVTGGLAGLFYGYYGIPDNWRNAICSVGDVLNACDLRA